MLKPVLSALVMTLVGCGGTSTAATEPTAMTADAGPTADPAKALEKRCDSLRQRALGAHEAGRFGVAEREAERMRTPPCPGADATLIAVRKVSTVHLTQPVTEADLQNAGNGVAGCMRWIGRKDRPHQGCLSGKFCRESILDQRRRRLAFARISWAVLNSAELIKQNLALWASVQRCAMIVGDRTKVDALLQQQADAWKAAGEHERLLGCLESCKLSKATRAHLVRLEAGDGRRKRVANALARARDKAKMIRKLGDEMAVQHSLIAAMRELHKLPPSDLREHAPSIKAIETEMEKALAPLARVALKASFKNLRIAAAELRTAVLKGRLGTSSAAYQKSIQDVFDQWTRQLGSYGRYLSAKQRRRYEKQAAGLRRQLRKLLPRVVARAKQLERGAPIINELCGLLLVDERGQYPDLKRPRKGPAAKKWKSLSRKLRRLKMKIQIYDDCDLKDGKGRRKPRG